MFREFGIGDEEEDNGLLLLLALEERESRVEVGYGLEGILPDGKTGRFQDQYMIPYFKDDNFDEGMLNGYKAFYQELANYYQITDLDEGDAPVEKEETTLGGGIIFFQIIFILFMIFIVSRGGFFFIGPGGFGGRGSSFGGGGFGGFGGGGFSGGGGSSRGF